MTNRLKQALIKLNEEYDMCKDKTLKDQIYCGILQDDSIAVYGDNLQYIMTRISSFASTGLDNCYIIRLVDPQHILYIYNTHGFVKSE